MKRIYMVNLPKSFAYLNEITCARENVINTMVVTSHTIISEVIRTTEKKDPHAMYHAIISRSFIKLL